MDTLIAPVISALKENHASVNGEEVSRAFEVARVAHDGQLRSPWFKSCNYHRRTLA